MWCSAEKTRKIASFGQKRLGVAEKTGKQLGRVRQKFGPTRFSGGEF